MISHRRARDQEMSHHSRRNEGLLVVEFLTCLLKVSSVIRYWTTKKCFSFAKVSSRACLPQKCSFGGSEQQESILPSDSCRRRNLQKLLETLLKKVIFFKCFKIFLNCLLYQNSEHGAKLLHVKSNFVPHCLYYHDLRCFVVVCTVLTQTWFCRVVWSKNQPNSLVRGAKITNIMHGYN